jgi:TrmH family RNA methyltransferase
MERITSLQNPRIKRLQLLNKHRERIQQQRFSMEGARELGLARKAGYEIESIYYCPEIFAKTEYPHVLEGVPENKLVEITPAVFEKLAYREQSDGIIALLRPKNHRLQDLTLSDNPFIIILEKVEKPGNLGAVLRTADAAKADAVIVCDPSTDVYNPNVIRSSVGGLFTVPVGIADAQTLLKWLQEKRIQTFAAELKASKWYHECDFKQASAIVMGTEADGLTDFWLKHSEYRIKIPMQGQLDSLNLSVSTAILTFEAMRQRNFNLI